MRLFLFYAILVQMAIGITRLTQFFLQNIHILCKGSSQVSEKISFRKSLRFRLKAFIRLFIALLVLFHLLFIGTTSLCVIAYKFINPPATLLMPYRAIFYRWKIQPVKPVKFSQIPRSIPRMLVGVEDGKFYTHHGIDFEAIKNARELNKKLNKRQYGGSTLTMQLARTLFLVPEKSYLRKYLELIVTVELELFLSKQRILELYLNYAEWGKGVFGISAAAKHWYNKQVSALSFDESARLVALLASPIRYSPTTLHKSGSLSTRYAYLLKYAPSSGPSAAEKPAEPAVETTAENTAVPPETHPVEEITPSDEIPLDKEDKTETAGQESEVSGDDEQSIKLLPSS